MYGEHRRVLQSLMWCCNQYFSMLHYQGYRGERHHCVQYAYGRREMCPQIRSSSWFILWNWLSFISEERKSGLCDGRLANLWSDCSSSNGYKHMVLGYVYEICIIRWSVFYHLVYLAQTSCCEDQSCCCPYIKDFFLLIEWLKDISNTVMRVKHVSSSVSKPSCANI